ncbi:hypothetical protein MMC21_007550 [Puttea exsequens]|nr:hypothetical protein [Puttea exsequens]
MHTKASVAFLAALVSVAHAWGGHDLHAHRHRNATYSHPSHPEKGSSPFGHHGGSKEHPNPAPVPLSTGGSPGEVPTIAVPSIPLSTGASSPSSELGSGDHTLTYTLGSGTSTTVVTTTIHQTSTEVITAYAVGPTNAAGESPSAPESSPSSGSGQGESGISGSPAGESPSSNGPGESGNTGFPAGGSPAPPSGQGESGAKGGAVSGAPSTCPAPITVTVTAPDVTVTVTASSSAQGAGGSPESVPTAAPSLHGPVKPGQPHTIYRHTTIVMTSFLTMPSGSPHPTGAH